MLGHLDKKFSGWWVGDIAIIVTSSRLQETLGVEPCVELEREWSGAGAELVNCIAIVLTRFMPAGTLSSTKQSWPGAWTRQYDHIYVKNSSVKQKPYSSCPHSAIVAYSFTNRQARLLLLSKTKLKSQSLNSKAKEKSWRYNLSVPPTTHPPDTFQSWLMGDNHSPSAHTHN